MSKLHLVMSIVASWWAFPRVTQWCDQRLTQQRIHCRDTHEIPVTIQHSSIAKYDAAEIFELLAIKIRGGVNARRALDVFADTNVIPTSLTEALKQQPLLPLQHVLTQFYETATAEPDSLIATLLLQAYREQSLEPSALDIAAQFIRDNDKRTHRIRVATAHARLTLRILTVLPVVALVASIVFSSTVRTSMTQPGPLLFVLIGVILDASAWMWMRNIALSVAQSAQPTELHQLFTGVSISVTAGDSLVAALERSATTNSLGLLISQALAKGSSLSEALAHLDDVNGSLGSTAKRLLLDTYQSGTPVKEVVQRLLNDADAESTRKCDIGVQQLSTKLVLPTVFCVLPAFLLLALMPVAIASFGALPAPTLS